MKKYFVIEKNKKHDKDDYDSHRYFLSYGTEKDKGSSKKIDKFAWDIQEVIERDFGDFAYGNMWLKGKGKFTCEEVEVDLIYRRFKELGWEDGEWAEGIRFSMDEPYITTDMCRKAIVQCCQKDDSFRHGFDPMLTTEDIKKTFRGENWERHGVEDYDGTDGIHSFDCEPFGDQLRAYVRVKGGAIVGVEISCE